MARKRIVWGQLGGLMLVLLSACSPANSPKTADTPPSQALPSDPLERAKQLTQRGDTAGAVAAYDALLLQDSNSITALGNRAALHAARRHYENALADYRRLLQLDPENIPALDRRASLHFQTGQYAQSLADLQAIAAVRGEEPGLLNRIGETQLRLGQPQAALQTLERALALTPNAVAPLRNRAAAYFALGDMARARADYQTLLDRAPGDSEALNGMGLIAQFQDGDLAQAESLYRRALLANPANAGAHYNIGYLEAGRNQNGKAIEAFTSALQWDPNYAEAYVNRGLLMMRQHEYIDALSDFREANRLQPSNAHTQMLLGWAKCETGQRAAGCLDLADAKAAGEAAGELIQRYCK